MDTTNIKGDIYGGITAAVVALPLALAFGVSSGAGPIAGLYGAIFVGLFAAIFGGTAAQISGPTGPMTVVMAGIFTQYSAIDPELGPALAFTVVMMGGIMQIGFGLLKIGRFIAFVPVPVVSGFMSGVGVIIILLELGPLLGHEGYASPIESLLHLAYVFSHPIKEPLMLGILGLLIVFFMPKSWNRMFPSPLAALLIGTLVYLWFLPSGSVHVLGDVPSGIPAPQAPVVIWNLLPSMLVAAATLAMLGSLDSLLTSLVADNITRSHHDSDKELIGQGIGNVMAGVFGGLAGAGATMRTVVNVRAGGRTRLSGALHALILLLIVLGASGFARDIPHAVLAAILIKVGFDIIDWDYLYQAPKAPKAGVLMMVVVLLTTVFIDLITAVAVGMIMASFVFMKRMADLQMENTDIVRDVTEQTILNDEEKRLFSAADGAIALCRLSGPLSFPAAKELVKRVSQVGAYRVLVMDFSQVLSVDYTSCRAIADIIQNEIEDQRSIILAGISDSVLAALRKQNALNALAGDYIVETRLQALQMASTKITVQ